MPSLDPTGVIREINLAWRQRAPDEIAACIGDFFTKDAVIVAPDLSRVARGRDAVAASYADFVRAARILDVRIDEPVVDYCGKVVP